MKPSSPGHPGRVAVVIGGTGMLAGVSQWLAGQGYDVIVLARRTRDLGAGVPVITCDYTRQGEFVDTLREIRDSHDSPAMLVSWIHSVAPKAADLAHEVLRPVRHIEVLGSAADDPAAGHPPVPGREQVILGFVTEGSTSRWLTHKEIVQGVVRAIEAPQERSFVGETRPWEARPR